MVQILFLFFFFFSFSFFSPPSPLLVILFCHSTYRLPFISQVLLRDDSFFFFFVEVFDEL